MIHFGNSEITGAVSAEIIRDVRTNLTTHGQFPNVRVVKKHTSQTEIQLTVFGKEVISKTFYLENRLLIQAIKKFNKGENHQGLFEAIQEALNEIEYMYRISNNAQNCKT